MPKRGGNYPILSVHDLITCLREVAITVTPDDIKDPKRDFVELIFTDLLKKCDIQPYQIEAKQFNQIDQTVANNFENYQEALNIMGALGNIVHLMNICGVEDFTMSDLIYPNSRSLIIHLSAIINFLKYKNSNKLPFLLLNNEVQSLYEEKVELEKALQISIEKCELLAKEKEQTTVRINQIHQEIKAKERELYEKQIIQENHLKQKNDFSKQIENFQKEIESLQPEFQSCKDTIEAYNALLMNDTKTLTTQINTYRNQINSTRRSVSELEDTTKALYVIHDTYTNEYNTLLDCLTILEDVDRQTPQQRSTKQHINDCDNRIENSNIKLLENSSKIKRLESSVVSSSQSLEQLRSNGEMEIQTEIERLNELMKRLTELTDTSNEQKREIDRHPGEINRINRELNELNESKTSEIQKRKSDLMKLNESVVNYCTKISHVIHGNK